ncbi:S66 peptidase family protein [Legionella clemsonensis]|uniref:Putative murein peptide carboxypeptidase n=1 Tax=Legionella clemsonensis TaxID=1867846 RepID=A0A222P3X1_9GAMM|nr:putative murein peptide carboxypeptidase [Legionella clemsonensis]
MDFFKDPEIKGIIATRGGQGSQRLLPLLDYHAITENPKILVGFSDTTALQLGILKMTGLVSYTGFTLTTKSNQFIKKTLLSCLFDEQYCITEGEGVNPGIVEAAIVGGNLSLLTSLIGTPYQPDFEGNILLLEDVAVEPFNIDRMLSHLELAGVFGKISGLIFGQFEDCVSNFDNRDGTIDEVISEWSMRSKVPCIKNFPYGHGDKNCVLPIGKKVTLDAGVNSVTIY